MEVVEDQRQEQAGEQGDVERVAHRHGVGQQRQLGEEALGERGPGEHRPRGTVDDQSAAERDHEGRRTADGGHPDGRAAPPQEDGAHNECGEQGDPEVAAVLRDVGGEASRHPDQPGGRQPGVDAGHHRAEQVGAVGLGHQLDGTVDVGRTAQGEPHRPGEQHAGDADSPTPTHQGGAQARAQRAGSDDGRGEGATCPDDHGRRQYLDRDEELGHHQQPEPDPDPAVGTRPAEDRLVGGQQDEWGEQGEGEVEVAAVALGDLVGREAIDQAADESGRAPFCPPAGEAVTRGGRPGQRQGRERVERGDRAGEQGHRCRHQPEQRHAGVVQQVDPERVVPEVGVQRVVPVEHGEGDPPEEPHRGELVRARLHVGRDPGGPGVPGHPYRHRQVERQHEPGLPHPSPPGGAARRRGPGTAPAGAGARGGRVRPPGGDGRCTGPAHEDPGRPARLSAPGRREPAEGWESGRGLTAWRQVGQQLLRRLGDLPHGRLEDGLGGR